jgi:hypothetical protein
MIGRREMQGRGETGGAAALAAKVRTRGDIWE